MLSYFHAVLQLRHVSLLHQLVKRNEFSEALSHGHDLSLSGQVERQLQGRIQPHLPNTAAQRTRFTSRQNHPGLEPVLIFKNHNQI